jgi:predicted N-acetyltransferase YhbS
MTQSFTLRSESPADAAAVDALVERAFGPGRLVKVSERVREHAAFRPDLSICAFEGGVLTGAARMWDVRAGDTPVAFLGPLAVEAGARKAGTGAAMVDAACEAARDAGACAVLLVGDMGFFGRLGFEADLAREVEMPGPVDRSRVLARWLASSPPQALKGKVR